MFQWRLLAKQKLKVFLALNSERDGSADPGFIRTQRGCEPEEGYTNLLFGTLPLMGINKDNCIELKIETPRKQANRIPCFTFLQI